MSKKNGRAEPVDCPVCGTPLHEDKVVIMDRVLEAARGLERVQSIVANAEHIAVNVLKQNRTASDEEIARAVSAFTEEADEDVSDPFTIQTTAEEEKFIRESVTKILRHDPGSHRIRLQSIANSAFFRVLEEGGLSRIAPDKAVKVVK